MKTLVLGGYGNFGTRICRSLAADPSIELLIGGRDSARAQALAATLTPAAEGLAIDAHAPSLEQSLRKLGVALVIHTAGPFQKQSYGVAAAAAAAGAHYIDLSDGRRYVCDFPAALQARFAAAGSTAITGASTVPALSSAVVGHLCRDWQRVEAIDMCIAPAQTAPRGKATLAAVLSYCGEPLRVWNNGRWELQPGWARPTPIEFQRMRPRLGALCDIPDLELFPPHFQVKQRVVFRAALEVRLTQRVFAALAALRRMGVVKRPEALAGFLNATAPALDFLGTSLGGMVVRVRGVNAAGETAARAWHLSADHDHGPEIPCMAAVLLARQLARGQGPGPGAFTAMGLLALDAFTPEFSRWAMVTDVIEEDFSHGSPTA